MKQTDDGHLERPTDTPEVPAKREVSPPEKDDGCYKK